MAFQLKPYVEKEADLQSAIIDYLRRVELGKRIINFARVNGGALRRYDGSWGARSYTLYLPNNPPTNAGLPDLEGVLRDGRYFGIECKSRSGILSKDQVIVAEHAIKYNIPYLIARKVEDVIKWLDMTVEKTHGKTF